uniref:Reverse transcriptase domain-containing protein n=1 Tax=Vitis vinifera TaxID=29760 RepID=A5C2L0_VITVI|nr:hypothetical protein VITISV_005625 [Vitis vinifera]
MQPKQIFPPACHTQQVESSDSIRVSSKRRHGRKSQLSNAMRARLGPQMHGMRGKSHIATAQEACPGPLVALAVIDWPPHPPIQLPVGDLVNRGPLGFVNRRLDDMLSTSFSPHIINHEPPRGFMVPKFSTYDGTNDPFDHIMHYRQLMTLDIENDALLCKMGFLPSALENSGHVLSGFNGASTTSLGDIVLPIKVELVILNVQLDLSPFNVIMGRTWLHDMKVIPSTYHQMAKVDKLLAVGFIREVEYPYWLANVVVVPKKGRKWRVCVNYTNLNDICPKDSFPLPQIDQIVDSTAGHGMLSFLDAFFQVPPNSHLLTRLYCYKVMSFGLKNAGATYQRPMTKIFKPLIGHTVEVYINDIVVKSRTKSEHAQHLEENFHLMRGYNLKLNLAKCAFGVNVGKFLGFMLRRVCPDNPSRHLCARKQEIQILASERELSLPPKKEEFILS